jgi:hypothetical protein
VPLALTVAWAPAATAPVGAIVALKVERALTSIPNVQMVLNVL